MQNTKHLKAPYTKNEADRIYDLLYYDLNFSSLENEFKDLSTLAASVAGTEVSLLNLIDIYTQWTVAGHGLPTMLTPRENTVCQYTILESDHLEVKDMQQDERFKDLAGIKDGPMLRYYFGVPLRTPNGHNIGSLCVLDSGEITLSAEKVQVLKTIAAEIVNRLNRLKEIHSLRRELAEARAVNRRVAHDIRGPIGGIVGLAQVLIRKEGKSSAEEVLRMSQMIQKSGNSLLGLAEEIMRGEQGLISEPSPEDGITLQGLKAKLEEIFQPQATDKAVGFEVSINEMLSTITFSKNKLLQIIVNLVTNALKFTPPLGEVTVKLDLTLSQNHRILSVQVQDTGIGLSPDQVEAIMKGRALSTSGTSGELGYGMGLQLVQHLLAGLQGKLLVESTPGLGSTFELQIPIGTVAHLE
ncbi:GAF domain-containing sensor histidine kinase [uncultured Pontibacter sp.]|uniref:GAF domain-containing sensor histidine kinase n=1 Tax=uncultured Pontibacter sp. TaxID=453356 RepID=UPI0026151108|nr:GAF domain-containing sensor histidine kinase [uncultured Pontibacter sp.]